MCLCLCFCLQLRLGLRLGLAVFWPPRVKEDWQRAARKPEAAPTADWTSAGRQMVGGEQRVESSKQRAKSATSARATQRDRLESILARRWTWQQIDGWPRVWRPVGAANGSAWAQRAELRGAKFVAALLALAPNLGALARRRQTPAFNPFHCSSSSSSWSVKLQASSAAHQASSVERRASTRHCHTLRRLHCGRSCPKDWGPFGRLRGPLGGGQFAASSAPLAATHRRPQPVCAAEGTHASFGWLAGWLAGRPLARWQPTRRPARLPPTWAVHHLERRPKLGPLEWCVCKERPAKSASLPVCQLSK